MGKDKATTSTVQPILDGDTEDYNRMYMQNLGGMMSASPGGRGMAEFVESNYRLSQPTPAEAQTLQNIYNRQSAPLMNPVEQAAIGIGMQGMDRYSGIQDFVGTGLANEYGRNVGVQQGVANYMLGQQQQNNAFQQGVGTLMMGNDAAAQQRINSLTQQALGFAGQGQSNANAAYGTATGNVAGYFGQGQSGVNAANAQGRGDVMGLMAPTQAQIDQYYQQALSGMMGTMGQGTGAVSGVGGQAAGNVANYYGQGGADIGRPSAPAGAA